jgi:asparagine synthase (glutamine-hydrolysing)
MDCALFDAARQQGIRVLFSGNDGDTTISYGYEFLAQLARSGRWGTLMAETTALAQRMNVRRWKIIKRFALKPLVSKPALEVWRRLRGHKQSAWAVGTVINPVFAREIGLTERIEALLADEWKPLGSVRENHVLNFDAGLLMYLLELLDKASAPRSLELRYPFFDRRLMELSLSLPPEQKLNQGWDRVVMRRAMEGILPPEIQWRTGKGNLSANFQGRFLSTQRATLDNVMSNELDPLEKYVDVSALRAAYQRYTSHPVGRGQDALNVFLSVTLALWMRQAGLRA